MWQQAQNASDIRREMDQIRASLGGDVHGLVTNAQRLIDWRHYVSAFPWASLGVAAAIGYFAVPRKLEIVSPDAETLQQLARDNRLVVEHKPQGHEKRSVMMSAANVVGNVVLRAGLAYFGQQVGKLFGEQAANDPSHEVSYS